ncbi:MAG TPA: biotin--[acetyl-CoA-carboxylase] ligase [Chitinophagaceae bacterium]|nr:biotin--[acetyl-CoA-carboxylase] ligase [Chitinophagaceae bacterium]
MPQLPFNNTLGLPFVELQSVDSTNNYAFTQLHAGLAQHGMAFFAHEQVAGKGQRGKSWTAPRGSSLIVSLVISPHPLDISRQFWLNACIALSAREFFAKYAGEETKIKWPNDIYWHDRKAGGVLIESIIRGEDPGWQWAVAGIGLNINQASFPPELHNPVSLRQITGREFDTVALAKDLCGTIDRNFQTLTREGFEAIYDSYLDILYKKNEKVRFRNGTRIFEAEVRSVSRSGSLVIRHGIEEEVKHGQIEWLVPAFRNEG